ncbi:MAG: hypothetical protein K0Q94_5843 [Paenibacillus sp.]|jgi:hypothetical protein|nr:hypothetical protein [Paenibacillus sp.]
MNQPHYPLLVYGATFAGLGIATAAKDRTLLVERTALVGSEFIASYNPGEDWESPVGTSAARQLREELLQRNLLSADGKVHLPAIAPVLFHFIRQNGLNVRMMTEIVDVAARGQGYEVTLFNASGLQRITVDHIIDTTSTCSSTPKLPAPFISKSINAMLHSETSASTPPLPDDDTDVRLVEGLMPGELILKLALDSEDDWTKARTTLHRYWERHFRAFEPWTLAALADAFEIRTDVREKSVDNDGWTWFPSSTPSNLIQSFDAGYRKGSQLYETILSA